MKKLLGLVAVAGLIWIVTPASPAQAVSLINPGIAASDAAKSESGVTEVRWRWHRHHRHHWRRWHHHRRWHWHRRHRHWW